MVAKTGALMMLTSASPQTSQDPAQMISSLNPQAFLSVKGVNSNQLTGWLGGSTEKTQHEGLGSERGTEYKLSKKTAAYSS